MAMTGASCRRGPSTLRAVTRRRLKGMDVMQHPDATTCSICAAQPSAVRPSIAALSPAAITACSHLCEGGAAFQFRLLYSGHFQKDPGP